MQVGHDSIARGAAHAFPDAAWGGGGAAAGEAPAAMGQADVEGEPADRGGA
jgi:hypothetical protein